MANLCPSWSAGGEPFYIFFLYSFALLFYLREMLVDNDTLLIGGIARKFRTCPAGKKPKPAPRFASASICLTNRHMILSTLYDEKKDLPRGKEIGASLIPRHGAWIQSQYIIKGKSQYSNVWMRRVLNWDRPEDKGWLLAVCFQTDASWTSSISSSRQTDWCLVEVVPGMSLSKFLPGNTQWKRPRASAAGGVTVGMRWITPIVACVVSLLILTRR